MKYGSLLLLILSMTFSGISSEKPNILFILVDDLGVNDLGVEGSTFYETPNIDGLANSGMRFTKG